MTEVTDIPSLAEADDYDPAKEGSSSTCCARLRPCSPRTSCTRWRRRSTQTGRGLCRRLALTELTKPGKHLLDGIGNDAELAAESAQILQALGRTRRDCKACLICSGRPRRG
jgi:hypothetical protein